MDPVEQAFRDGAAFQRAVAAKADELGPMSPEFAQWCRDMDAWRAASSSSESG